MSNRTNADIEPATKKYLRKQIVEADIEDDDGNTIFDFANNQIPDSILQTPAIRTRQANVPLTEIADTNNAVGLRKQIPSDKTLRIYEAGVQDDSGNVPSGLNITARDVTNGTDIHTQTSTHGEGSPLASKSGDIDVAFRIENATGGTVNASGYVLYTME